MSNHRFALRVKTVTSSTRSHHTDRCVIFVAGERSCELNKFLPSVWNHDDSARSHRTRKRCEKILREFDRLPEGLMRQPAAD
jgi:hypothetical protein